MQKRRNSGFTLVELVVTIAVLAILAGVGAVAYGGYITKANEAHDQVLIGAVNTAFASACVEAELEGHPEDANASLMNKKVYQVTADAISGFNEIFFKYFEGNRDEEFKVVEGLLYDKDGGFFYASLNGGNKILLQNGSLENKGTKNGVTTWEWEKDGKTYTLTTKQEDIQNFNNSSFGNNMTLDELTSEVDNVVKSASEVLADLGDDFLPHLLTKQMQDYLESHGIKLGTPEYKEKVLNALVLQCAQQSKDWSIDEILTALQDGQSLRAPVPGKEDGLFSSTAAAAAIKYGAITAFANSEVGKTAEIDDPDNPGSKIKIYEYYRRTADNLSNADGGSNALDMIEVLNKELKKSNEYQEYLDNGEARKDLEGYFAAMSALNDNAEQFMESGVLGTGYTDESLKAMLGALLGG